MYRSATDWELRDQLYRAEASHDRRKEAQIRDELDYREATQRRERERKERV